GRRARARARGADEARVIAALALLLAVPPAPPAPAAPPDVVVIATPRGETAVPVTWERGGAAVAAPLLVAPLGVTIVRAAAGAATVGLDGTAFVFELGLPSAHTTSPRRTWRATRCSSRSPGSA